MHVYRRDHTLPLLKIPYLKTKGVLHKEMLPAQATCRAGRITDLDKELFFAQALLGIVSCISIEVTSSIPPAEYNNCSGYTKMVGAVAVACTVPDTSHPQQ